MTHLRKAETGHKKQLGCEDVPHATSPTPLSIYYRVGQLSMRVGVQSAHNAQRFGCERYCALPVGFLWSVLVAVAARLEFVERIMRLSVEGPK